MMRALPDHIEDAFRRQAEACAGLGSPFTERLCTLVADRGIPEGAVHERIAAWKNPVEDALALRFAGALHFLVLNRRSPELLAVYPPSSPPDDDLYSAVADATDKHGEFIADYLDSPPQTNEVARCSALLPAFLHLHRRFELPFVVSEIGASAGLIQNWHRYRYEYKNWSWGDPASPVAIRANWNGPVPPAAPGLTVSDSRGCDIAPVPITLAPDRMRLRSYIWPDQQGRLARLDGALAIARYEPPSVDKSRAGEWMKQRFAQQHPGALHVVVHTIMWQYLPEKEQKRIRSVILKAGEAADEQSPLAWLNLEPDDQGEGAAIRLMLWDGASERTEFRLGRADFHGRWVKWAGLPSRILEPR